MAEFTRQQLDDLVADDKIEEAAKGLETALNGADGGLRTEVTALRAELKQLSTANRRRQISGSEYSDARRGLIFTLLSIADSADFNTGNADSDASEPESSAASSTVFLSYNHSDVANAVTIKTRLEAIGIAVVIDREAMQPGELIRDFILRSIRETDATLCLVSASSLESGWVSFETVNALADIDVNERRRFIACYLDESPFKDEFQLEATDKIDARVAELDALLEKHAKKGTTAPSLSDERARLLDLRHNMGRVIQHLQSALSMDVRPDAVDASVERIAASLTEVRA